MKLPTFCLIVGHTAERPGATGAWPDDNQSEYDFNRGLAVDVCHELLALGSIPVIVYRDDGGITGAYQKVNRIGPYACVELHFNAFNREAAGSETWCTKDHRHSPKLSELLQAGMVAILEREGRTDRGVKILTQGDRGYASVSRAKCPSALIEPFFGDNPKECELVDKYRQDLAKCIASSLYGLWRAKRGILWS